MPCRLCSIALLLTAAAGLACGSTAPAPNAPTPSPSLPGPVPSGPNLVRVFVGYGTQETATGTSRQFHAYAVYSNDSIVEVTDKASWRSSNLFVATISETGLLTTLHDGVVDILAAYQGKEGDWEIIVRTIHSGPPGRGEVIGQLYELGSTDDVVVTQARVTISGGAYDGRSVDAPFGSFRFQDIFSAMFDLVVTSPGYQTTRYGIAELPRDANSRIRLAPEPWIVSEAFEAPCATNPPHSTFFTPRQADGVFRITGTHVFGYTEGFFVRLLADGTELIRYSDSITTLHAGTTYELRVGCDPGTTFRVNYLRPR